MIVRNNIWWWFASTLPMLPVLYVLSEAPLVRITESTPFGGYWGLYRPVDWLIDDTQCRGLLLQWADLWGAKERFKTAEWYCHPPMVTPIDSLW